MITRWDKVIIGLVVLLAVASYLVFSCTVFGEQPESVEISVDGKRYATYNLAEINRKNIVEIDTEFGYNLIEITNRGARMLEASCPDKTDIQSGEITKTGQVIICAPNRVSVKIVGKTKSNVDMVTY